MEKVRAKLRRICGCPGAERNSKRVRPAAKWDPPSIEWMAENSAPRHPGFSFVATARPEMLALLPLLRRISPRQRQINHVILTVHKSSGLFKGKCPRNLWAAGPCPNCRTTRLDQFFRTRDRLGVGAMGSVECTLRYSFWASSLASRLCFYGACLLNADPGADERRTLCSVGRRNSRDRLYPQLAPATGAAFSALHSRRDAEQPRGRLPTRAAGGGRRAGAWRGGGRGGVMPHTTRHRATFSAAARFSAYASPPPATCAPAMVRNLR